MSVANLEYARAVPINALIALGFGRDGRRDAAQPQMFGRLEDLQRSNQGVWAATQSAGRIGRRLLSVIRTSGGSLTSAQLELQTPGVDPHGLAEAIDRLVDSALLSRSPDGSVTLTKAAKTHVAMPSISLTDHMATTSDVLGIFCRALALVAPSKKQDRVEAIANLFASKSGIDHVRGALSAEALDLLDRIAQAAGPASTKPETVGLSGYSLHFADPARHSGQRSASHPDSAALVELATRGIVGVAGYEHKLWIWREAWPLIGRPFYRNWSAPSAPQIVEIGEQPARLATIVAVLDQLLRLWETDPPPTLKNGDARIGKSHAKAAAKSIGADEVVVELAARLAIGIQLLRRNRTGVSGRGRNQRVDEAWMGDQTLVDAWTALAPAQRWARLVAQWFVPSHHYEDDELVNRQLLIWQLAQLSADQAYVDAEAFVAWFADRYYPMTSDSFAWQSLSDLRALGVITASGGLALTTMGRAAIENPDSLSEVFGGQSTTAMVQGDLSIIAPPDLRDDLTVRIESLALVESSSGATVYRLDPARITRVVQGGESADDVIAFLGELSPVPLPDIVARLVRDAAAKAGTVRVVAAATVVVVTDPSDLVTACSIKALRLIRLTDTVGVTDIAVAKVRTALERKGLTPETLISGGQPEARSSAAEAAEATNRAAALRAATASGRLGSYFEREALALDAHASSLANTSGRLAVHGPLTLTPTVLERLAAEASSAG